MNGNSTGRLSTLQAALVIARRDFFAVLLSRNFLFFLIGPLITLMIGVLAGGIGRSVQDQVDRPVIGLAMAGADVDRMIDSHDRLAAYVPSIPAFTVAARLRPGEAGDPVKLLETGQANLAAVISGTPEQPVLTGRSARTVHWRGPVALIAAEAVASRTAPPPEVRLVDVASSGADRHSGRIQTAQAAQLLLFLLTMLLAGMVMSNLVEEKGNKIIEILAAAIPMDAVFLGKLFAMLGVSLVGIATWTAATLGLNAVVGGVLQDLAAPAVGWPLFMALGVTYFAMAYLLLGSVFLSIGAMAATVRDVQTLSMPVTMLQVLIFFFASYALGQPGSPVELAAMAVPFSSPYAMLARAAQDAALWPHLLALAWQFACVMVFVRTGAAVFRKRVLKSGPATARGPRRGPFARLRA